MKQNAISKINRMGEIGGYLTIIARIFVILGLSICLLTTIAFMVIPNDFMTVGLSGNAKVAINLGTIGVAMSEKDLDEIQMNQKISADGSFDLNGSAYYPSSLTATEDMIQVDAATKDFSLNLGSLIWIMIMAVIKLVMTLVTLFFIGALCKAFRHCESPFEENVIKKMQNLAISLIPWTVLSSFANAFAQSIFTGKFAFNLSANFNVIMIIILILALVYIFKYGAVLQRESDETL